MLKPEKSIIILIGILIKIQNYKFTLILVYRIQHFFSGIILVIYIIVSRFSLHLGKILTNKNIKKKEEIR